MGDEVRVPVTCDGDMVPARAQARALAVRLGFSRTDATLIATAVSEIARNIVTHGVCGELVFEPVDEGVRCGLVVIARDSGPGIRDLDGAMEPGPASLRGLGLGIPGARRLMDEFAIESTAGGGTTVTMKKWRVRDELEAMRERRRNDGHGG